jgi:hypothetical protein
MDLPGIIQPEVVQPEIVQTESDLIHNYQSRLNTVQQCLALIRDRKYDTYYMFVREIQLYVQLRRMRYMLQQLIDLRSKNMEYELQDFRPEKDDEFVVIEKLKQD